jgi:Domain of unknown function (DUF4286)
MVLYEVTLQLDEVPASELIDYMTRDHIPAIWATGCFRHIRFDQASPTRFRTSYQAEGQADLDRYLRDYAAGFRAEFASRFSAGVAFTREVWTTQEMWP